LDMVKQCCYCWMKTRQLLIWLCRLYWSVPYVMRSMIGYLRNISASSCIMSPFFQSHSRLCWHFSIVLDYVLQCHLRGMFKIDLC